MRALWGILVVSGLTLTGCAPSHVEPSQTADAGPIFASEAEAAAAAERTLDAYAAAGTKMGQSGGEDFSGYEDVISDVQLADEESDAENLKAGGKRLVGEYRFFDFQTQYFSDVDGESHLTAHVCMDISTIYYVDANGVNLSVEGHAAAVPQVVDFVATAASPKFVLDGFNRWTGLDFCS